MTTTSLTRPHEHAALGHLRFSHVVRAEWIKLRTLRSTFWTLASVIVLVVGIASLVSFTIPARSEMMGQIPAEQQAAGQDFSQFASVAATAGLTFAALVIAVLGVLVISGEFSTGMIRSSLAAVPHRFPVLAAKTLVLFVVSFVIGLVSSAASWAVAVPLLNGKGYNHDLLSAETLWATLGAGLYLGVVSVFALGVGTIVKSTAGGIAAALGALLVLPIIASLVASLTKTQWFVDAGQYLLSNAGSGLAGVTNGSLEPWANAVTVIVWAVVALLVGAVLLQRRDA